MKLHELFSGWPFSAVPDRSSDLIWAGRPKVQAQIESLLRSFEYRPQSTLDLVWAVYGSGKTHLLYFIEHMAEGYDHVVPWYCIVPRNARSFSDIYAQLMETFPFRYLDADLVDQAEAEHPRFEVIEVLKALTYGAPKQRQIAEDWLAGRRVDMRSAPSLVDVPYKLDGASQMQRVFSQLVRCFAASGSRVLLLMDEYQRVLSHRASSKEMLSTMVLDTYNETPERFSVIFSCSAMQQAKAEQALTAEMVDRMRGREKFELPAFTPEEAESFILELMADQRPKDFDKDPAAPFTRDAIELVIERLEQDKERRLIPRHLLQCLDAGLMHAAEENLTPIDQKTMDKVLERVF